MFKKARESLNNFNVRGERFRKEVKREIRMLVLFTLGFTIAFTWRQTLFDIFEAAMNKLFAASSATLSVLTSTAITLFSILLILLISYFLQDKD